jgi:hypothetical protein
LIAIRAPSFEEDAFRITLSLFSNPRRRCIERRCLPCCASWMWHGYLIVCLGRLWSTFSSNRVLAHNGFGGLFSCGASAQRRPRSWHGRGMRQGGPLSPLLFVIVMDVLEAMFLASEHNNILVDLQPLGLKHRVSLYTDDLRSLRQR